MENLKKNLLFVLQSAIVGLAAAFLLVALRPEWLPNPRAGLGTGPEPGPAVDSYAAAVQASAAAVVNIFTLRESGNASPRQSDGSLVSSLGSGVIVDPGGYILTNHHVIRQAALIRVQLNDGRIAKPELVGSDWLTDLALLKIDLPDLPAVRLGRSDELKIGDVVLAIGNPYGLGQTVTQGIVSATGRGIGLTIIEDFIQTDAAINLGNSGGALINARGELVGINIAALEPALLVSELTLPEGIGFAIPVNLARGVMDELVQHGRVIRAWLGVQAVELTPARAEILNAPVGAGVVLSLIVDGSPAAIAGLQVGDVITRVNGQPIVDRENALNLIARLKPGAEARIAALRDGQPFEVRATVIERPDSRP